MAKRYTTDEHNTISYMLRKLYTYKEIAEVLKTRTAEGIRQYVRRKSKKGG